MEFTDYQGWRIFINALQIFAIAILWINNKNKVTADSVARWEHSVNDRIDENQKRLVKIETQISNMPEFKNMEYMRKEMHGVDNKLSKIDGRLDGLITKVNIMDKHLMEHK